WWRSPSRRAPPRRLQARPSRLEPFRRCPRPLPGRSPRGSPLAPPGRQNLLRPSPCRRAGRRLRPTSRRSSFPPRRRGARGACGPADGKDLARRTPATIELPAGTHQVVLSLPDLGRASFTVSGESGSESKLDAPLDGSLTVRSSASTVPIAVSVDGTDRGYAPLRVNDLAPGPHQLELSGPGMAPWGQTIEVRVRGELQV